MTNIVQMSKGGTNFYPKTHVQAVVGLPDFSSFEKSSDVQTAISTAIKGIPPTDLSNYTTKSDVQTDISSAIKGIPPTDLSNYPTKSDVTTEISTAVSEAKPEFGYNKIGEIADNLLLKTDVPFSVTGTNVNNQLQPMYSLSRRIEAGTIVTLSFDAVSTASTKFIIQNDGKNGGSWMSYINDTVGTTKKHYVGTITLDSFTSKDVEIHLDNVPSTTTVTISNMKLELGSNETGYSVNPEDITQTMSDSIRSKLQNMNKEMGS